MRVADLAASVEEAMKELSWLVGNWQMRGLGSDWSGLALVWMVFFLMLNLKIRARNLTSLFTTNYYSINQIDMCRISLSQILRSESQENHF